MGVSSGWKSLRKVKTSKSVSVWYQIWLYLQLVGTCSINTAWWHGFDCLALAVLLHWFLRVAVMIIVQMENVKLKVICCLLSTADIFRFAQIVTCTVSHWQMIYMCIYISQVTAKRTNKPGLNRGRGRGRGRGMFRGGMMMGFNPYFGGYMVRMPSRGRGRGFRYESFTSCLLSF